MGNLFGVRRRAPQITAQDRAILQLKQQRDKIKIYQKRVEADLEHQKQLALTLFQKNMTDRALVVFKRTKCMTDVLTRTDKQLETLESLVTDIEYTQIEVNVVEGLRVGTEALKQLNNMMNIEDIHKIMEDNAEAAEKQREISAILQQTNERYDESELLEELEKYKQQEEEELPAVPAHPVAVASETSQKVEERANVAGLAEKSVEIEAQNMSKLDNLPDVPEDQVPTKSSPKREGPLELAQ